jgi:hypothetical protein
VYLQSHGWIPVDANIGKGRDDLPTGFGKLSNNCVILNRGGSWTSSTWLPPNGYNQAGIKPKVRLKMNWEATVLKEDSAALLYRDFMVRKRASSKRR